MARNPLGLVTSLWSDVHRLANLEIARQFGRTMELAPASLRVAPEPVALPGEFDRVTRTHPESNFELERLRLAPGPREHSATLAHVVEDAVLYEGALVRVGRYYAGPRGKRLRSLRVAAPSLPRAMVCNDTVITRYFGHWMHDGLPLELLARKCGLPAITCGTHEWLHGPDYRTLLGLQAQSMAIAQVGELWLVDDRGLNDARIARLEALRKTIRQQVAPREDAPRKVFLMRGRSGAARELSNEAEIEATLLADGFVTLHPERSSVAEIVTTLAQAELVVAVEGSAQSHYLLAGPASGRLLSIQPPQQFNAIFKTFFDTVGVRWGYVVADPAGDTAFTLPVSRLRQSLDLLAHA